MSEPRRLLSDSETSELSRSLLTAGRARREPPGARERVWGAVAAGVAGGAATGTTAGGAAAAGASGGAKGAGVVLAITKMKLLVVGSVIATAATVTALAIRHDEPAASVAGATAAAKPAETIAPVVVMAPEAKHEPPAEPEPPAKPLTSAPPRPRVVEAPPTPVATQAERDTTAAPAPISNLREEAALLQDARAALGRGDTAEARTKLDDARKRFPTSQLAQERDALDVRLASESGDRARAASLARAFVERYPESPLRGSVQSFARTEEKE